MHITGLNRKHDAIKWIVMREGPLRARRQQVNSACAGKSCMRFAVTSPLLSNRCSCIECQKDRTDVPRTGLLRPREVLFQEYSLPRNMRARKQRCFFDERHCLIILQYFNPATISQAATPPETGFEQTILWMYRPHFGREQNRSKKFQELTNHARTD